MSETIAVAARRLLLQRLEGVLSTQSRDVPGYPFGSVVNYLPDASGHPVLLISRLAQHTVNLAADGRCSLTVVEPGRANVQEAARLTWLGMAERVATPPAELVRRFSAYWPEAGEYLQLDFEFWRIGLHRARFIGGFGKIHWVEPGDLPLANPLFGAAEESIVSHMNTDHMDALQRYCAVAGISCSDEPVLAGVDSEGMHLRVNRRLHRIGFPKPAPNPGAVRQVLIDMARNSPDA